MGRANLEMRRWQAHTGKKAKGNTEFVFRQGFLFVLSSFFCAGSFVYQRKQQRASALAHRPRFCLPQRSPETQVSFVSWYCCKFRQKGFFVPHFFLLNSDYGGGREGELDREREWGGCRSSTSGLKTYVTVGSPRIKQEPRQRRQSSHHAGTSSHRPSVWHLAGVSWHEALRKHTHMPVYPTGLSCRAVGMAGYVALRFSQTKWPKTSHFGLNLLKIIIIIFLIICTTKLSLSLCPNFTLCCYSVFTNACH